jgi:hypothetical protein
MVGVDFDRIRTGGLGCPSKPLTSKPVRLGRGPAAKALQTRIWLVGETNGRGIASGGYKPEGPGAYRMLLHG